jgi:hypothetical protein
LHAAGFRDVRWHQPMLSPAGDAGYGRDYWSTLLDPALLELESATCIDGVPTRKPRFAGDSPLEGDGFELPVPRKRNNFFGLPPFDPSNSPPATETGSFEPGTDGSNPSCTCGESDANLTNTRRNGDRQAGGGYRSKAAKTALSPFI